MRHAAFENTSLSQTTPKPRHYQVLSGSDGSFNAKTVVYDLFFSLYTKLCYVFTLALKKWITKDKMVRSKNRNNNEPTGLRIV